MAAALLKYSNFKYIHFHISQYHLSPCKASFNLFLVSECQILDHLLHTLTFSLTANEFPSYCALSSGKLSAILTLPGRLCKQKAADREEFE